MCPGIGAPLAGMQLDETIALGADRIVFFGSCGVIDPKIKPDALVLLNGAVSDEGTSRLYANRRSDGPVVPDRFLTESLRKAMAGYGIPFTEGKSWTTDAAYRETPGKIASMRRKGCVCVDMEASALLTIARFYGKRAGGFLVPGDRFTENAWRPRDPGRKAARIRPAALLRLTLDALITGDGP